MYSVELEISGATAMWTRPDTGDAPVSYPAPTYAAAKGIFESVLWLQSVEVVPTRVEICRPLIFQNYTTNYGGPLRKSRSMNKGAGYQLLATVLIDVCYRIYADLYPQNSAKFSSKALSQISRTTNSTHAYKEMFDRRLKRGQCFSMPCMGWKEFVPDYFGVLKKENSPCLDINMTIPSMLNQTFSKGIYSNYNPTYRQNVKIVNGVLNYVE